MTSAVLTRVAEGLGSRKEDPRLTWRRRARPEQRIPPGDWRVCYWQGGRGSGKTASGAGALAEYVLADSDGDGEYGIVGPTYADAWTKCVEGEAGILQALGTSMKEVKSHTSSTVKNAWRTYGQVVLHNGITIFIDSAAEGGLRIQGRNLKALWADEIGLWLNWETAWNESIRYAVRKGVSRIIATATPKASRPARKLIRSLIRNDPEHGGVVIRKLKTKDNAKNLSPAFLRAVLGAAKGTRLELQELEGELLDDVANALWTRDQLESIRCPGIGQEGGPAYLRQAVIGVDPSDGAEDSDEQAYTVAGRGDADDPHLYIAENFGGQMAPVPFAKLVIRRAVEYDATIIIEKNHGGRWLESVFLLVMKEMNVRVKYKVIHASQAKRTRAEPVSALYDRGGGTMVQHCWPVVSDPCDCDDHAHPEGHTRIDDQLLELEDQMATFTGADGERSPDRLDSLVWACTPFLKMTMGAPARAHVRKWAGWEQLDAMRADSHDPAGRMRSKRGGVYDERQWSQIDWGPHNDDTDRPAAGSRGNVRTWGLDDAGF